MNFCFLWTQFRAVMGWSVHIMWNGRPRKQGSIVERDSEWWGNLRERDHWRDPGVDGRIILRWIFRRWNVGVWAGLSWLRRDMWRALVNAVMNLRVPQNALGLIQPLTEISTRTNFEAVKADGA
jgi:hypothetical protein